MAMTETPPTDQGRAADRSTRLQLLLAAALVAVAAVIVANVARAPSLPVPSRPAAAPPAVPAAERRLAPAFSLPSLRGADRIALSDFAGQVVVMNFFASWCGPCELEAADLERVWQANRGRGVTFVGIAVQDRASDAAAFVKKHAVTYPAAIDERSAVMQTYRVSGIPTTVIVDAQGRIASVYAGIFVGDEGRARLQARIDAARNGANAR